jgi:hypothetical protein
MEEADVWARIGINTEVGGYYIFDLRTKHVRRLAKVVLGDDAKAAWGKGPG